MVRLLLSIFAILAIVHQSNAASTDWVDLGGGKVRLIAVQSPETGTLTGALEFQLEPGWKTYWRSPGDSGIPPLLDFSRSKDFLAGEIRLPTPEIIQTEDVTYVGYKQSPTFLFDGQFTNSGNTGEISIELLVGLCEEVCIPAQASLSLPASELNQSDLEARSTIETAQQYLPESASAGFSITGIKKTDDGKLRVSAKIPGDTASSVLLTEGPDQWYFEPSHQSESGEGDAVYLVDLSNIPAGEDIANTNLRFTILAGGSGIEQWKTIDD